MSPTPSTTTARLVAICRGLHAERPTGEALAAARRCLLDSIAVACAALGEPALDALLASMPPAEGPGGRTVVGHDRRARADDAALVNGTMISLQLFDDTNAHMQGHPSAPILPAVLALGEGADCSLERLLAAFIVGYEVECKLGLVLNPAQYEKGWHATATQGTMAATIASGLMLGRSDGEIATALGIAASMAGGVRRNFGTMTMALHSGLAASHGIRAMELAARGFTGDPEIFDGTLSFGAMFSSEWDPAALEASLEQWGRPLSIAVPGPNFKLYPCGRPALLAIDCVAALLRKEAVDAGEVARVVCDVSYMYPRTLIHRHPTTGLQGKTSLQYCVAAALLDRPVTLASFTDEAVRRTAIADLIDRIAVRVPPELGEDVPEVRKAPFHQPVGITIETRDGRVITETVRHVRGSPQNPASDDELRAKLVSCARGRFADARLAAITACLYDDAASVRELCALLRPDTTA